MADIIPREAAIKAVMTTVPLMPTQLWALRNAIEAIPTAEKAEKLNSPESHEKPR